MMNKNASIRTLPLWVALALVAGCATSHREILPPLEPGMARVYFQRHSPMPGAVWDVLLLDTGENLDFDTWVLEKESYSREKGNFASVEDFKVTHVFHQLKPEGTNDSRDLERLLGPARFDDKLYLRNLNSGALTEPTNLHPVNLVGEHWMPADTNQPQRLVLRDSFLANPNAWLVSKKVEPGEIFSWDRPAGAMRLEVVSPDGTRTFARPFTLESGKLYYVDFYYRRARFDIHEVSWDERKVIYRHKNPYVEWRKD